MAQLPSIICPAVRPGYRCTHIVKTRKGHMVRTQDLQACVSILGHSRQSSLAHLRHGIPSGETFAFPPTLQLHTQAATPAAASLWASDASAASGHGISL